MAWVIFCEAQSHYVKDCWIKEYGKDFYAMTSKVYDARKWPTYEQAKSVASDLRGANISYAFHVEQFNTFTEMQP